MKTKVNTKKKVSTKPKSKALKQGAVSSSVISELSKEQQFYITLISRLNSELITEQIITPMQKSQIEKYILDKMQ